MRYPTARLPAITQRPRMKPFWFRFCLVLMFTLDWIPGYCRYYTLTRPIVSGGRLRFPRERHWGWQWHALWGFRLMGRMGMTGAWINECERRDEEENPSSAP